MGSLIPNPDDLVVIDGLNARFSGTKLQKLRDHMTNRNDDFFAVGRRLRRVTWRLKIFPTSSNRPKGRWLTFLNTILPAPIHDRILAELRDAVGFPGHINNNCVGVRFWAVYDPGMANTYELVVVDEPPDGAGLYWKNITLKCLQDINNGVAGDPSNPPADNGEQTPAQPTFAAKKKKYAGAGAAKKANAKKAAKGKSKKAAKRVRKR